jgi:hypothetical protein
MVLNVDQSGTLLRSDGPEEATGFGVDLSSGTIYFGASGGAITPRDLGTLAAGPTITPSGGTPLMEDMTFDGSKLWRASNGDGLVHRINPLTGFDEFDFSPGFSPLGMAWDGKDLWVSQFAANGSVEQFTTAGVPTGKSFNTTFGGAVGGLAYDTTDGTLWVGTFGEIFHYSTTGVQLGSFAIPVVDGRFADGLEFQGVPEPASFTLFGTALATLVMRRRKS